MSPKTNISFLTIFIYFFHQVFFFVDCLNFSGRSYYFKTNGNNEFTVYNRIHFLNHNISDFDANPHPRFGPENIKVTKKVKSPVIEHEPHKNLNLSNFFLDEEWNYTHKLQNNSNLPFFIKRFYEQRLKHPNKTNAVRILFNINSNTTSSIIKFNLDSLKPKENVSDADLYFYWPLENSSSIYKTSVVLRLYQFEKQFNNALNESNLVENPDVHKLFNVIYISKAQKGWQTFKIKKPIDNWAKGEDNLGLLLTISSYDDNKLVSVFNDTNQGIFRTFAVLNVHKNETFIHPTTNSTNHTTPSTDSTSHNSTILTQNCSIKPWQVDFRHLQWDKFIVYPELGFMAYQCAGKCHLDDPDQVNHVKLRMLNGLIGAKERSCCVATEFLKLPIMYYDKVGNVVLKTYDDMVVKECGCR